MNKKFTLSLFSLMFFCFIAGSISAQTVTRRVLFEEMTNASCGPCALNNPTLKAYIDSKGDNIVAIKYHSNIPGFDPMYLHNPTQSTERWSAYYGMNASPWLNVDGKTFHDVWPFTQANLDNAYNTRIGTPTPVTISVVDTRLTGDTIMSTITVNNLTALLAGDYKLRVFAIEGVITYGSPPGSNGETVFEHVFRKAYPNTAGTTVATTTGPQVFVFKYVVDPAWVNSNVYTVAFVQNDGPANKEVMNAGSGDIPTSINPVSNVVPERFSLAQNYPNPFNPMTKIKFDIPSSSFVKLVIHNGVGKEVSVLVNENLTAGSYETQFNGEGLTSGVYFYSIITEGFTETKKMLLVK